MALSLCDKTISEPYIPPAGHAHKIVGKSYPGLPHCHTRYPARPTALPAPRLRRRRPSPFLTPLTTELTHSTAKSFPPPKLAAKRGATSLLAGAISFRESFHAARIPMLGAHVFPSLLA